MIVPELHGQAANVPVALDVDHLNLGAVRWIVSKLCAGVVGGDVVDADDFVLKSLTCALSKVLDRHRVLIWVARWHIVLIVAMLNELGSAVFSFNLTM
eukprot:COSAG02_NODE_18833_length_915_cov_3.033531_1_plen_98_part_00